MTWATSTLTRAERNINSYFKSKRYKTMEVWHTRSPKIFSADVCTTSMDPASGPLAMFSSKIVA